MTSFRPAAAAVMAALALLSACQVAPGSVPTGAASKKPVRDDAPRTAGSQAPSSAPSAAASAGVTPSAAPTGLPSGLAVPTPGTLLPSASAVPAAEPEFLSKPAGATTLAGTVALDASYLVSSGAGQILSHNGGVLVAAGGGNILSHNGSQILSHNGGVMIAAGGGNILSHNGGVMIAAGAGNLVAAGGGNLVAAGGGNLVAAGGGNYRLAQAEASATPTPAATATATATPGLPPEVGTIAPAAGVEIGVWSIEKRGFLPIGVDNAGQPVYTVYTNLEGKYELYMPAGEEGNGIVVAVVDRESADPRLSYGVMTPIANQQEVVVDEDTALVTSYVRDALAARLRASFSNTDTDAIIKEMAGDAAESHPELVMLLKPIIEAFGRAGRDLGLGLPENAEKAKAACRRATDYALRRFDLVNVPRDFKPGWYGITKDEKPFDVLLDVMRTLRAGATAKLAADPGFADKTSFMPKINARRATEGLPAYVVRKPSDFGQIAVDEYLTILDEARLKALAGPKDTGFLEAPIYYGLRTVLRECDALSVPAAIATKTRADGTRTAGSNDDNIDRLNVGVQNILFKSLQEMFAMSAEEHAEMRARLAEPKP